MSEKTKKVLLFLIPFVVVFSSYLTIYFINNFGEGYGVIAAFFMSILYLAVTLIIFFILRVAYKAKAWSKSISSGLLWGSIASFVYLFTIGGCGIF